MLTFAACDCVLFSRSPITHQTHQLNTITIVVDCLSLSPTTDIKQGIHIEAALRNTDFQTRAIRATTKSVMRSTQKAQKKEDRSNRKLFGGSQAGAGGSGAGLASPGNAAGKKKYNVQPNSE